MLLVRWLKSSESSPVLWTCIAAVIAPLAGWLFTLWPAFGIVALIPSAILLGWLWPLRLAIPLVGTFSVFTHMPFPAGTQALPVWALVISTAAVLSIISWTSSSLRRMSNRAESIARQDFLTGLSNAFGFREVVSAERNRAMRFAQPLSIAFLDCDDFKLVNDNHGHNRGDELLVCIAERLQAGTRNYDTVARMGGDEFAIILPNTTAETARVVMERLNDAMQGISAAQNLPIGFSIGCVTFSGELPEVDDCLCAADRQMYQAKENGKGCVSYAEVANAGSDDSDEHAESREPVSIGLPV